MGTKHYFRNYSLVALIFGNIVVAALWGAPYLVFHIAPALLPSSLGEAFAPIWFKTVAAVASVLLAVTTLVMWRVTREPKQKAVAESKPPKEKAPIQYDKIFRTTAAVIIIGIFFFFVATLFQSPASDLYWSNVWVWIFSTSVPFFGADGFPISMFVFLLIALFGAIMTFVDGEYMGLAVFGMAAFHFLKALE